MSISKDLQKVIESNRNAVLELYNYRCILNPAHKAEVIHEIEPRSIRPSDWWELDNMCPLCNNCHELVHASGVKTMRKTLMEKRHGKR